MLLVFRVQVTPPDAEFWKFSIQKLTRSAPSRARRRETTPRRFCFFLRLLAQKEGKRFAQRIPQQYTPSKALGMPRASHIPQCRRHLYILHKTHV
jgi:hypothetical protein